jgi:pimeloyl-ACP methyl ester carboxylesterase
VLLLAGALAAGGCQHSPVADPVAAMPSERLNVRLPNIGSAKWRSVDIWIARPVDRSGRPLVLHLTGDSGRHGLDLQLFTAVSRWGYPIAVLSSPDWIDTLIDGVATRESLARDLDTVARAAARATGVPEGERVVLLGLSRGAGLAVEAATDDPLRERLRGVVALGLCPHEERVRGSGGAGRPYRDKTLLTDLPLEVIQSTHDRYLGAAGARKAFGPDTELQVFHPIEATSHTFVGGREALFGQLELSLARVAGS